MVKKFEFCQPRFGRTPILIPLNFVKFYLSYLFTLASKVKKFEFCRANLAGKPIESPPIFVKFSLFLISTCSENFVHLAPMAQKFKNLEDPIQGNLLTSSISAAKKFSLISSIAQNLNAVREAV